MPSLRLALVLAAAVLGACGRSDEGMTTLIPSGQAVEVVDKSGNRYVIRYHTGNVYTVERLK